SLDFWDRLEHEGAPDWPGALATRPASVNRAPGFAPRPRALACRSDGSSRGAGSWVVRAEDEWRDEAGLRHAVPRLGGDSGWGAGQEDALVACEVAQDLHVVPVTRG